MIATLSSICLAAFYFLFAFCTALFTVYICFRVVMRITKYNDIELLNENNQAAAFVLSGAFVAMAIMSRNAIYPMSAVFQDFWNLNHEITWSSALWSLQALGYLLLTLFLSLFSLCTSLFIFTRMTKHLDEEQAILNGNTAVGIFLAGVLIAFAVLVESGIESCVNALIPVRTLF